MFASMKATLFSITLLAMIYLCIGEGEKYPDTWDDINVDEIIANDRLMDKYTSCLKGQGRCSMAASTLKRLLPDALKTQCSKCTEKQKVAAEKVIKHLSKNKPKLWQEMSAIYDPDGSYFKKYMEDIEKNKSNSS